MSVESGAEKRAGTLLAGPSVAEAMARGRNNFTLIRLALALAVVVSHGFSVVSGQVEAEPLHAWTGFTLGEHAVNGFFVVSGFLVTMSYDRRGWRDYAAARALRIAPGLVAATLVVAFLIGGTLTALPLQAYLTDPATWRFVTATLTTFKSNTVLPGVFAENPFRFPMGTVWTLKYEVLCYLGVLALGLCGLLRSRGLAVLVVAGLFAAICLLDLFMPEAPKAVQTSLRLPFLFALGGAFHRLADRVRLSLVVLGALAAATAALQGSFLYNALLFATEAYGVLWLALVPVARVLPEPKADLSYGTYLYGWPIQQALHSLWPAASGPVLLMPAIAISLIVAWLSWRLVEKPALALKARLVRQPLKHKAVISAS